ncbi:MAG: GreA/GreB family elongation factor [Alphaproteobacteria bacterium]|nr:GreA/GreB family elongation factor [Alphaproteobacteria bacterium]
MSVSLPDKAAVVAALRAALAEELAGVEAMAALARDEASSDETRQEGKYDTRATEASYLARGQAWRIAELRQLSAWFEVLQPAPVEAVGLGALVALDGPRAQLVFVAPVGGLSAIVGGQRVQVISLTSPLGVAGEGLEEGDAFEVESPAGRQEWEIVGVA